jgi:hypothetical protein
LLFLLGENNTLKNRYMMINPPEEWKMPENEQVTEPLDQRSLATAGTQEVPEQTQDKHRTSTGQVQGKLHTDDYNIIGVIKIFENEILIVCLKIIKRVAPKSHV